MWVRAETEVASSVRPAFYDNLLFMAKSIKDNRKITRGRPATGTAPLVGVRMQMELQDEVRAWAKEQPDSPKLATAVRQLVEIGLSAGKRKTAAANPRAIKKAIESIDRSSDQMVEIGLKAKGK